jgi:hypothetical protein
MGLTLTTASQDVNHQSTVLGTLEQINENPLPIQAVALTQLGSQPYVLLVQDFFKGSEGLLRGGTPNSHRGTCRPA